MSNDHTMSDSIDFIHRFVPARASETAPTLLLLHGTGGSEEDLLDLGRMVLPHASLLSPRGKVLENGMSRFFRRLAEGVLDQEDLRKRTHELADFVVTASLTYHFDPSRVLAAGFSNGANVAASMLFLRPEVLAGAILLHPMLPFVPEQLPDLARVPVYIAGGRKDPLVPVDQTEQLAQLLQQSGSTVTVNFHNGGHSITHEDVRGAREWLKPLSKFSE